MQIAPRSLNQVLTDGVNMLARVWKGLLVPAVGAAIPLGVMTLLTYRVTGADDFLDLRFSDPLAFNALTPEQSASISMPFLWGSLIALALNLVASGFISLATHRMVGAQVAGSPISGGTASRFALSRMIPLILAASLAGFGVAVGLLLLVVPGIWLLVMISMTPQVIALEEAGVIAALRRSFRIVRGRWWPTAGYLVMVGLLGSAAGWMIQLVAAPLLLVGSVSAAAVITFVLAMLIQGMMIAAIAVMTTVWYLDLRARKELLVSESLI